ncbi:hypothetical protein AABB24_001669, partial [Solanum stoloniferum]
HNMYSSTYYPYTFSSSSSSSKDLTRKLRNSTIKSQQIRKAAGVCNYHHHGHSFPPFLGIFSKLPIPPTVASKKAYEFGFQIQNFTRFPLIFQLYIALFDHCLGKIFLLAKIYIFKD